MLFQVEYDRDDNKYIDETISDDEEDFRADGEDSEDEKEEEEGDEDSSEESEHEQE